MNFSARDSSSLYFRGFRTRTTYASTSASLIELVQAISLCCQRGEDVVIGDFGKFTAKGAFEPSRQSLLWMNGGDRPVPTFGRIATLLPHLNVEIAVHELINLCDQLRSGTYEELSIDQCYFWLLTFRRYKAANSISSEPAASAEIKRFHGAFCHIFVTAHHVFQV